MEIYEPSAGKMDYSDRKTILWLAIYSRGAILFLSFLSNLVVPDHNATDVFIYRDENKVEDIGIFDRIIHVMFGGLIRWDANYFLHISHYGYTKENILAFFPLFPFIVRSLASLMYLLMSSIVLYSSMLLLSSILVNFILFVKSSLLLYDLTIKLLKNNKTAYYSAVIFCVNPASIFFTAPYSETVFTFLTFSAMLHSLNHNFVISSMITGLSCAARSNGILNVGFILYTFIVFFIMNFSFSLHYLFSAVVLIFFCFIMSLAPFCLFQLYAYVKFCLDNVPLNSSPLYSTNWCNDTVPLAYNYVQKQYWNVGFLRYYQFKQIPNFLLALPIIYIILYNSYDKLKKDKVFLYNVLCRKLHIISEIRNRNCSTITKLNYLVFIIHAAALTVFCTLFVHVQISTRMLCSSSPVFYWYIADYFIANDDKKCIDRLIDNLINILNKKSSLADSNAKNLISTNDNELKNCGKFGFWINCNNNSVKQFYIKLYMVIYFVFGTILFSNFYPWT